MILRSDMLPLLVESCPSFSEKWNQHKIEYADEEDFLPYVALSRFGEHLIQLHDQGETLDVAAAFEIVESLHVDGEPYVREAATIGLLEGLQNHLSHSGRDPDTFRAYLLPMSERWWDQLNLFWNGDIKYVGETIEK